MAAGIVNIIASILAYLSAWGIDKLIGKWAAYFTIAWEKSGNAAMKKSFSETVDQLKIDLPAKYQQWESWRSQRKANDVGSTEAK